MSGVIFAYAGIEIVAVTSGEMKDYEREVPKAVKSVVFRIGIFYVCSILLLVCMLPTQDYKPGISPFVTVFDQMGAHWMSALIQAILIIAALSSINSGLYATGRVLRSLGMMNQAPAFTLRMSARGVPWGGVALTAAVFASGAILNAFVPNAFEIALEAGALGVIFTWATIFLCQLKLRSLVRKGLVTPSRFPMPGYPITSIIGLCFLAWAVVGLAISGWQSSPHFAHKVTFLVVVIGIPVLVLILGLSWLAVRPAVAERTGGRLGPAWQHHSPTPVPDPSEAEELSPNKEDA